MVFKEVNTRPLPDPIRDAAKHVRSTQRLSKSHTHVPLVTSILFQYDIELYTRQQELPDARMPWC